MSDTFDFKDGNGPVPAHRHPNGGGWVADTAFVAETAFIGWDAWVSGNARISGNARVYRKAHVSSSKDIVAPTYARSYARGSGRVQVSMCSTHTLKDLVEGLPHYYLHLEELIEAALEMESE